MSDDNRQDDADWLKDAFDRALRGDNGVAPDAARPAASPFGVTPTPEREEPVRHNELDLDFETESTVPPQAFLPVVDFGDDDTVDDSEPDPFAVFARTEEEPPIEAPPTEAIDVVDVPTVVSPMTEPEPTGSLDGLESLFGEDKFADATTALIAAPAIPTERIERETPSEPTQPAMRPAIPRTVLVIGGSAIATIALAVGAFVLGSTLAGSSSTPEPVATEDADATSTREPGTWAWNQMFGGECIDPFPGAWAESFDVVDCTAPHAAQLVAVGDLAEGTGGTFPGVDQAASLAQTACSAQGVLDLATAGAYPNIEVNVAYPVTQEQWDSGETRYYCFVSLADASSITGSVAGTGASPEVTE